jgi:hypothetical protein
MPKLLSNSLNEQANGSPNWGEGLPPLDGFQEENQIKETVIAMKKITSDDIRRMVRKVQWTSGTTYEMYRHDYNVYNKTPVTNQANLYGANFYVINEDFRVYICLQNGTDPENPTGRPSFDSRY